MGAGDVLVFWSALAILFNRGNAWLVVSDDAAYAIQIPPALRSSSGLRLFRLQVSGFIPHPQESFYADCILVLSGGIAPQNRHDLPFR